MWPSPVRWWRSSSVETCWSPCAVWGSCSHGVHLLCSLTYTGRCSSFCQADSDKMDTVHWFHPVFSRLYKKHGEVAVRSFSQFYPTVTPADVAAMSQRSHFLAYLDNLVQSQMEEHRSLSHVSPLSTDGKLSLFLDDSPPHRLSFLQSLLEPESQKQDWLELALAHDAPQRRDTMTPEGNPRSGRGGCRIWMV